MIASKWDKAAGKEMWKAGKTDKEIAEHFGVSASAVNQIRKKYWETEDIQVIPEPTEVPPLEPSSEAEAPAPVTEPQDEEEDDAKVMIRALELMTQNLQGMNAVMTAQILTSLWAWDSVSDLLAAREFLDYLIERAAK